MMSFWVVPWSDDRGDAVLLRHRHVEGEQPGRGGVDRHRRVHLVERDAVEQRVHVALVGDRDADLADLAARQLVIGVVAGLGGQVEGDREPGLALGEVPAGRARSTPAPSNGRRRCASPRGRRARANGARSLRELYGRVALSRAIDVMHLGRDRVICAYEVDGLIVDPGPASCVETLLDRLGPVKPRALLLTHIHLDHAGATGRALPALPGPAGLRARARRAAPDRPSKLLESAGRLYGDDMWELWGEVAPVPEDRIHPLRGGETVEGFRVAYTPGHASHHVCYLHEETGDAYVGDVAGVRIPPYEHTVAPTPPPDIDVEAWLDSLHTVASWNPHSLCLTHFGQVTDVADHLHRVRYGADRVGRLGPPRRRGALHRARSRRGSAQDDRSGHRGGIRAGGPARPALPGPAALLAQASGMTQTVEKPRVAGPGDTGLGGNWRVIVLNDDHNTFEGVADALSTRAARRQLRQGHGAGQPDPQQRPGDRLVRRARAGRALLRAARRARAHDGSAGARLSARPSPTIS